MTGKTGRIPIRSRFYVKGDDMVKITAVSEKKRSRDTGYQR